uniref:Cytochrome b5 heme-binding domain-containing protein n=1 Tax=Aureoumbra lagunensis TaxID=44058 RepID=A0A7S3K3F6_9STRA|mmetsp:Transcript_1469/g.1947  ORF Transcript_1469/g.1947 Transcript_1469/m.1947 type:complete len:472 (-) Transcript_1469:379-1794(-)|eukprot:CAMPEP_0197314120 /NCGR_PEP_ID=MMETSP0891-20130614/32180_1 /TAXON_ID=44058 ORGANISM="Aureoumbra lagunensis, Strain CCMP1510" /NCGR_SAMPLE_ID=MMETSP0891 /ASSEMBLY_ACC=CAM_ASM_000534 /LENGTH=471 /DNA_ID=CAMNT_0042802393 /DNA_START=1 /DNA_END=1416 /DNA_ORIENTATION=+
MGKGGERPPKLVASEFAWAEVTKHRTPNDAYLVVNNKVYDVSGWHDHPGGDVIFTAAGDDATDTFTMFHANGTSKHLDQFCIGSLDETSRKQYSSESPKTDAQLNFERGYRSLRIKLKKLGLFDSSPLYYAYKQLSTLMIAVFAALIITTCNTTSTSHLFARLTGAIMLGIFFQQCGWLCHEILHHQVFPNRNIGRFVGYLWGNLAQGFSVAWWTNKHNTHHAVPNVHATGADAQNGDPDIDTMPFLAWSRPMLQLAKSKFSTFMVSHQHIAYFPLLALARLSWLEQSLAYVLNFDETAGRQVKGAPGELKPVPHEKLELTLLGLHYSWYLALAWAHPTWFDTFLFILVSNVACGLALASVFGLGHNGMAVYDAAKRPDYWKLQVTTTRNIAQDRFGFVHWFCGGLDYQVEHHLFPSVPRHNLGKVSALCKEFCKEHGISYHETGFFQGNKEVLDHLKDIAHEFIEHFPAM